MARIIEAIGEALHNLLHPRSRVDTTDGDVRSEMFHRRQVAMRTVRETTTRQIRKLRADGDEDAAKDLEEKRRAALDLLQSGSIGGSWIEGWSRPGPHDEEGT